MGAYIKLASVVLSAWVMFVVLFVTAEALFA